MASQITMVSLDSLVSSNHIYRKFDQLLDFSLVEGVLEEVSNVYPSQGAIYADKGYCGNAKNQFAAVMEAICFNLRRVVVLCG